MSKQDQEDQNLNGEEAELSSAKTVALIYPIISSKEKVGLMQSNEDKQSTNLNQGHLEQGVFLEELVAKIRKNAKHEEEHIESVLSEILGNRIARKTRAKPRRRSKKRKSGNGKDRGRGQAMDTEFEGKQIMFDEMFFKNSKMKDQIFALEEKAKAQKNQILKLNDEIKFLNYKLIERSREENNSRSHTAGHNDNVFEDTFGDFEQQSQRKRTKKNNLSIGLLLTENKGHSDKWKERPKNFDLNEKINLLKKEIKQIDDSQILQKEASERFASPKGKEQPSASQEAEADDIDCESDLIGGESEINAGSQEELIRLRGTIENVLNHVIELKEKGHLEVDTGKLIAQLQKIANGEKAVEDNDGSNLLYSASDISINSENEDEIYQKDTLCERLELKATGQEDEELKKISGKLVERYKRLIDRVKDLKKMKEMYRDMYFKKLGEINSQKTLEDKGTFGLQVSQTKSYKFYNLEIAQLKEMGDILSDRISLNLSKNLRQTQPNERSQELDLTPREVKNRNNLSFARLNTSERTQDQAENYQINVLPARGSMKGEVRTAEGAKPDEAELLDQIHLKKRSGVKFVNFLLSEIQKASDNSGSKGKGG